CETGEKARAERCRQARRQGRFEGTTEAHASADQAAGRSGQAGKGAQAAPPGRRRRHHSPGGRLSSGALPPGRPRGGRGVGPRSACGSYSGSTFVSVEAASGGGIDFTFRYSSTSPTSKPVGSQTQTNSFHIVVRVQGFVKKPVPRSSD